jgi:hypothetical protein
MIRIALRPLLLSCLVAGAAVAVGQQPVRPIPPPGIEVPEQDAKQLAEGIRQLGGQIDILRKKLKAKPRHLTLLPDVEIFHKSADWALRHREFFDPKQIAVAKEHVLRGMQRAQELFAGKPSWPKATGLVVRGYVSAIDGSVQPYGLEVPENWKPGEKAGRRLDFWMHGRGEKLSELDFIEQRLKNKGEFAPQDAFVLHLYGRYCCANKFAGEVDLFEALAHAREHYTIDPDRLVVRGFSMGGGSCWQFATHFGSLWAAAAPGAGFAESKEFLRLGTSPDKPLPVAWEQTLWRWYDATVYAGNLANVPTIAYSGETDGQKQAADIMLKFLEQEGLSVPHVIGPQTAHKYHPDSKREIEEFLAQAVADRKTVPETIRFTTYTLIYPKMGWVEVEGLERHWERADVVASLGADGIEATTKNVTAVCLHAGELPRFAEAKRIPVVIDGERLDVPVEDGRARLHRGKDGWRAGATPSTGLRKQPGLCGPIDHAFMAAFVMVKPTGSPCRRLLAEGVSRRCAGEERQGRERGRHRAVQPRPLGRPLEQRGARPHPAAAPHRMDRQGAAHGRHHPRRRPLRAGADLSEPAQPAPLRRGQQRRHVSRGGAAQQRQPDPEAARLGRDRPRQPARRGPARQGARRRLLRRAVGVRSALTATQLTPRTCRTAVRGPSPRA